MPAKTEPNSGLKYGWNLGESGWNTDMDDNLFKIGTVLQLSILDRDLTAPPGSPANGDRYIVASGATGAWAGQDGNVAVWDAAAAAWRFYVPAIGWLAYIEDEQVLSAYKSTGWSAGIAI